MPLPDRRGHGARRRRRRAPRPVAGHPVRRHAVRVRVLHRRAGGTRRRCGRSAARHADAHRHAGMGARPRHDRLLEPAARCGVTAATGQVRRVPRLRRQGRASLRVPRLRVRALERARSRGVPHEGGDDSAVQGADPRRRRGDQAHRRHARPRRRADAREPERPCDGRMDGLVCADRSRVVQPLHARRAVGAREARGDERVVPHAAALPGLLRERGRRAAGRRPDLPETARRFAGRRRRRDHAAMSQSALVRRRLPVHAVRRDGSAGVRSRPLRPRGMPEASLCTIARRFFRKTVPYACVGCGP